MNRQRNYSVRCEADEFQESILCSVEQHISPYDVMLKDKRYTMFPNTFNPNYAKPSLLLLDNLGVKEGDTVLDPFTGCGADAIFAVLQGATRAVAIDKYTMPVLCAKYNAFQFKIEHLVDVRQGDVFDPLGEDERHSFDLVIANPPFGKKKTSSTIQNSVNDVGYASLNKFWSGVGSFLKDDGRIRAVFSNVGDVSYFERLADKNGYSKAIVAENIYAERIKIQVYEFKRK